jgi:RNA polymerase sigma-70 factor (ECF subfamily)
MAQQKPVIRGSLYAAKSFNAVAKLIQMDPQPTRASLLLKLRDTKNADAWEQFAHVYTPIVYGFCRKQGLQDADASDVSQEVMRAVARAMQQFEYDHNRGKFRSWLLTVTRSKLSNFFRSRQRQPEPHGNTSIQNLLDREPTPVERSTWDAEYHRRLFHWAADQVKPTVQSSSWQAFWRTTIDQEDPTSVAADLKLTVGALYVAKSRVLAKLKEKIQSIDEAADVSPRLGG